MERLGKPGLRGDRGKWRKPGEKRKKQGAGGISRGEERGQVDRARLRGKDGKEATKGCLASAPNTKARDLWK